MDKRAKSTPTSEASTLCGICRQAHTQFVLLPAALAPGSKLKSLYPLTPLSVSICHSNLPALRVDERFSFRWTSADRSRRRPHDITSRQIANLPLTGYRNYQSLIDLVPGATPSRFQNAHIDSPQRSLTTNINRTSRNSNNTRIDGATSVFPYLPHHTRYVPPAESSERRYQPL
jgi:hypothetical protein